MGPDECQDIGPQRNLGSLIKISKDAIAAEIANQPPFTAGIQILVMLGRLLLLMKLNKLLLMMKLKSFC